MKQIAFVLLIYELTKDTNTIPALLRRTAATQAPAIRGPSRLLLGPSPFPPSRAAVRLHPRRLPSALPPVPSRPPSVLLRKNPPWPTDPAEEVRRASADYLVA